MISRSRTSLTVPLRSKSDKHWRVGCVTPFPAAPLHFPHAHPVLIPSRRSEARSSCRRTRSSFSMATAIRTCAPVLTSQSPLLTVRFPRLPPQVRLLRGHVPEPGVLRRARGAGRAAADGRPAEVRVRVPCGLLPGGQLRRLCAAGRCAAGRRAWELRRADQQRRLPERAGEVRVAILSWERKGQVLMDARSDDADAEPTETPVHKIRMDMTLVRGSACSAVACELTGGRRSMLTSDTGPCSSRRTRLSASTLMGGPRSLVPTVRCRSG